MTDDRRDETAANASTLSIGEAGPSLGQVVREAGDSFRDLPIVHMSSYDMGAEIAKGGMGRIVAARDRRLDRPVAIKQLLVRSEESRRRFEREIRLSARLQHPSIVNILEAGQWPNGDPFYAMKLVSGRPLSDVIKERSSLAERLALLPGVIAAADALAYAHDQQIIHRDLKPHNVLIGDFGETVVIDWGLAKDVGAREAELPAGPYRSDPGSEATEVGAIIGTPAYMPPEQARGEVVDQRADVYALGAMLYHVLAGHPPFIGSSSEQILKAVLAGTPEPLERRQPDVPADLVTIVGKAMAADPAARYASAAGLADDLKRFQTGQLVSAHEYSAAELVRRFIRRHRAAVMVAAALLAVLATGAVISVRNIVTAERSAQEQRTRAQDRARELMLQKARELLGRDPTLALTSLRPYLTAGGDPRAARIIAADAWTRGVSRRVLRGHESNVTQVGFLPDGTIASTSYDGTLRLWDQHGKARVLGKPGQNLGWMDVAKDGRTVVTRDGRGTFWAWTVATGASRSFDGIAGGGIGTLISPDSRWLIGQGADHKLWFWSLDAADAHPFTDKLPELDGLGQAPAGDRLATSSREGIDLWTTADHTRRHLVDDSSEQLDFSPDGKWLAAVGSDGVVRLWTRDGEPTRELHGHSGGYSALSAFTADGAYLVTSASPEPLARAELYAWDLATGHGMLLAKGQQQGTVLKALPSGHEVAAADSEGTISIWDVEQGSKRTLLGHESFIYGLGLSPDGARMASASVDASVRVWDLVDGRPRRFYLGGRIVLWSGYPGHSSTPQPSALSAAADRLVTVRGNGVELWNLSDGSHRLLGVVATNPTVLALAPDGSSVAVGGGEAAIRLYDAATGAVRWLDGGAAPATQLLWAPAGDLLVAGDAAGGLRLWGPGEERQLLGHDQPIVALAISADGALLASADQGGTIRLWDMASGRLRTTMTNANPLIRQLAFSPDARHLVASGRAGTVQLWDLSVAGTPVLRLLNGHVRDVRVAAFSPDGRTLATGSGDHTIRLWSVDGEGVRVLAGHANVVSDLAWSPDGGRLVSSSSDRTARLWDVASGSSRPIRHEANLVHAAFAPDGRSAVSWGEEDVQIWSDDLPYDTPGVLAWIDAHTGGTAGAE